MFKKATNLFKVLIIGNSTVGKTSILLRYIQGSFGNNRATIGADILVKTIVINGRQINLQIWDTSGDEKFRSVTQLYYRGADACIMVFDVSNPESFTCLQFWMQEIIKNVSPADPEKFPFIVLANKVDIKNRAISANQAERWSSQYNMPYVEVSAKDDINIDFAFKLLATNIMSATDEEDNLHKHFKSEIHLDPHPSTKKVVKPGCC